MSVEKTINTVKGAKLSMKVKLILSLSSIAAILLISCTISVMEYTRMSNYVSELISADIRSVGVAHRLSDMSSRYNLDVLAVIGDESLTDIPSFDDDHFKACCDSLRSTVETGNWGHFADSVLYAYSAYMLTAKELDDVLMSDFIDSRTWFFERFQPKFDRLNHSIDRLTAAIYDDLKKNSATFDRGFYRSVIPGIVAIAVGLLLTLMLMLFILSDYVKPIYRMLAELRAYKSNDKKYSFTFDGDDQLSQLNESISELTSENRQLRERIKALRSRAEIKTFENR